MKSSTVCSKRATLLFLLLFCDLSTSSNPSDPVQISSPLYIYQRKETFNIKVYRCRCEKWLKCHSDCFVCPRATFFFLRQNEQFGILSPTCAPSINHCQNILKAKILTNRKGFSDLSDRTYTSLYIGPCNSVLSKTLRIELIADDAEVNIMQDKIILKTGTTCRFSSEHCTDNKIGIVLWSVKNYSPCNRLKRVGVVSSYSRFSSNQKDYVILQSDEKYLPLEINSEELCGKTITRSGEFIVSWENIAEADNDSLGSKHYMKHFFPNLQGAIDSVTEKYLVNVTTRKDSINKFSTEQGSFPYRLEILFYLGILCVCVVVCVMCCSPRKQRKCRFDCSVINSCAPLPKVEDGEGSHEYVKINPKRQVWKCWP